MSANSSNTTTSTTTTTNNQVSLLMSPCLTSPSYPNIECQMAYWILSSRPYLLIVLGTIGNFINILTLFQKRLRTLSTSVFLIFLAVSDLMYVYSVSALPTMQHLTPFYCKALWLLGTTAAITSAWLLVLVSLERMVYVQYPIIARVRITWKTALIVALVTCILSVCLTGHILFGHELNQSEQFTNTTTGITRTVSQVCAFSSDNYKTFKLQIWPTIFLVISFILPVAIMTFTTAVIVSGLRKQGRQIAAADPQTIGYITSHRDRRNAAVSRMMIFVSVYFILTVAPSRIYIIIIQGMHSGSFNKNLPTYALLYAVLLVADASNYVLNCVFYFACGTQFKREWQTILHKLHRKIRRIFPTKDREDASHEMVATTAQIYSRTS